MPRRPLLRSCELPYHIVNRSNNKEFFYISTQELWPIFVDVLSKLKSDYGCSLHAFVLMSNHYHLVLTTPHLNLSESMTYLHREVARLANRQANRVNHFFGGRYKWCLLKSELYYLNTIKYVFQNPVRAGMCELVEDYPYSSISSVHTASICRVARFPNDPITTLDLDKAWLNTHFKIAESFAIRRALRRREFKLGRCKSGFSPQTDFTLSPQQVSLSRTCKSV